MINKYDNSFNNEEDLLECLERGCEVEFEYNKKSYSITHIDEKIIVCEFYNEESEKIYSNPKDALSYSIEGLYLKDIINKIKILSRSF
ncbi:MAG: hypothetical protein R3Y35_12470 [Clostridia bacterium]